MRRYYYFKKPLTDNQLDEVQRICEIMEEDEETIRKLKDHLDDYEEQNVTRRERLRELEVEIKYENKEENNENNKKNIKRD